MSFTLSATVAPITPAPILSWDSASGVNVPQLTVSLNDSHVHAADDIVVGQDEDIVEISYADNSNFASATTVRNTLDNLERTAAAVSLATGKLADRDWWIVARHNHRVGGKDRWSVLSNVVTKSVAADIPVLSDATVVSVTGTHGHFAITTDEATGIIYWVVTTSSTQPSAAQIRSGQNHSGATASRSGTFPVTDDGEHQFLVDGLTDQTVYYLHATQRDASGNDATVISTASFETDSTPPPVLSHVTEVATTGTGGGTTRSASSVSIGTAYTSRRVIGICTEVSGRNLTGVSINGGAITGTIHQGTATGSAPGLNAWSAVVPTGTTLDVTLTYSSTTFQDSRIVIFTVDDDKLLDASPVIEYSESAATTSIADSIVTQAEGLLIACSILSAVKAGIGVTSDETLTKNTATVDNFFNTWMADDVAANATSDVTVSWTGSADAGLMLFTWR